MITKNILDLIGNTPLIKIENIYAKLETVNPSGSIKDRAVLKMIEMAEERGIIKSGFTIIEATTGNTGISLSMIGSVKGYKVKIVMPENMSKERIQMMKAFGAEVILTPAARSMEGATEKAEELTKEKNTFFLDQFKNKDNIKAHEKTGEEVLKELKKVDALVAGIGTGGTLMGMMNALKKVNPDLKVIGVQPEEKFQYHKIQGIGDGFKPEIVDIHKIDKIIKIYSDEAIEMTRKLAKGGLLVGISSGANVLAAFQTAKKYKTVVTVLPDRGERYLSMNIY